MDKTKISVVIFVNFPNIHITLSVQPPYAGLFAVHAPAWNRNRLLSNISDIYKYIYIQLSDVNISQYALAE